MRTAAVLGCGRYVDGKVGWAIGHAHGEGWRAADPEIRLIGVDPNAENLAAFGERFGLRPEDLFPSTDALYAALIPDFVSVCTWPKLHAPQVMEAAERGVKGVLCEKPMATSPGSVHTMLSFCREKGVRLAVAHQRLFSPAYGAAKKLLHEGRLGENVVLEFRVGGDWDVLSWTTHWFDLANFLLDELPVRLMAGMDHDGGRIYGHAAENRSVVSVEYPSGAQAIFVTGPPSPTEGFWARGTLGFLRAGAEVELFTREAYSRIWPEPVALEGFAAACAELIAAVETGAPMALDAERASHGTLMAFAAQEAFRTGRSVAYPTDFLYAPMEAFQRLPRPRIAFQSAFLWADAHFGSGGREGILEALSSLGLHARTSEAFDPGDADCLLVYHTLHDLPQEAKSAFQAWVEGGRPVLFVHCAVGAFPDWPEYAEWVGRVWVWEGPEASCHPYAESLLCACNGSDWPWTDGWLPEDEVFARLKQTGPVRDLVVAQIGDEAHPAAWMHADRPNIGVWIPGHRRDLWRLPAMRTGLAEMLRRLASG